MRNNILHLISSKNFFGAERFICELTNNIDNYTFNIKICLIGSNENTIKLFKENLRFKKECVINLNSNKKFSLKNLLDLKKYIIKNEIQMVHSHGYKSDLYAYLLKYLCKNIIIIATNHNWIVSTRKEIIYKYLDINFLKRFDKIVAVSEIIKNEMIKKRISSKKVTTVNNGITSIKIQDYDHYKKKNILLKNNNKIIGCVASLTKEKAHSDLIIAFYKASIIYPDILLFIIGSGPLYCDLKKMTINLDIEDKVKFIGYRKDVRELYSIFDIFALVSHDEGLPMALLEAMDASLPIIATSVGSIPKVINNRNNGFLVKPGSINDIFRHITLLLENENLRNRIGNNARNHLKKKYVSNKMAHNYAVIYRKLLEN